MSNNHQSPKMLSLKLRVTALPLTKTRRHHVALRQNLEYKLVDKHVPYRFGEYVHEQVADTKEPWARKLLFEHYSPPWWEWVWWKVQRVWWREAV